MLMARSEWGRQIIEIGAKQFSKARDAAYPHASKVRVRLARITLSRKHYLLRLYIGSIVCRTSS
jgi:hypothetical protein